MFVKDSFLRFSMPQKKNNPPETGSLEGKYVNHFRIGHTEDVFVFDYYQIFPEKDIEELNLRLFDNPKFRIIVSPADAKQLLNQLSKAIEEYDMESKKHEQLPRKKDNLLVN